MLILIIIIVGLPILGWFFGKNIINIIFLKDKTDQEDITLKNSEYYLKKYDFLSNPKPEIRNVFDEEKETKKLNTQQAIECIELIKQHDDFDNTTRIYHKNITQKDYEYLPMYFEKITEEITSVRHIGISFMIFENQIFLNIYSSVPEMGLAKSDKLVLLFENDKRIEIVFENSRSSGYIKSNSHLLNAEELKIFIKFDLLKWKLISTRKNLFIVGDNTLFHEKCQIDNKNSSQQIIKHLAKSILEEYLKNNKEDTAHNIG